MEKPEVLSSKVCGSTFGGTIGSLNMVKLSNGDVRVVFDDYDRGTVRFIKHIHEVAAYSLAKEDITEKQYRHLFDKKCPPPSVTALFGYAPNAPLSQQTWMTGRKGQILKKAFG